MRKNLLLMAIGIATSKTFVITRKVKEIIPYPYHLNENKGSKLCNNIFC